MKRTSYSLFFGEKFGLIVFAFNSLIETEFWSPSPLKRRFFGESKCLHLRAEA
jgi:hypothetical protein